jgi:hypothetical protein
VIRAEIDEAMGDAGLQTSQYSAKYYESRSLSEKKYLP